MKWEINMVWTIKSVRVFNQSIPTLISLMQEILIWNKNLMSKTHKLLYIKTLVFTPTVLLNSHSKIMKAIKTLIQVLKWMLLLIIRSKLSNL